MDRRTLIASLAFSATAGVALAQPPAVPAGPQTPGAGRGPGGGRGFGGRGGAPAAPVEPALPMTVLATGLKFPEAPVLMKDGSLLFVQIPAGEISRLTPNGKVETFVKTGLCPNGLAVGPDGALYVANNGNRFGFGAVRADGSQTLGSGGTTTTPPIPGIIQRVDLKTKAVETFYTKLTDGTSLIAPDDLVMDGKGGFYVSEYGRTRTDGAILYGTVDGKLLKVAKGGLNAPNGIGVSPDGKFVHITSGNSLYAFDVVSPGVLEAKTYPNGLQAPLVGGGTADSLKLMADGTVAACTLLRPGGISLIKRDGTGELLAFPDRYTTNIAFGGADARDAWLTLSDTGRIAKVRWPAPGMMPVHRA